MNNRTHDLEIARIKYASMVVLGGLVLSAVLVVTLFFAGMKTSSDIVAIVGIISGMTGTLVGTFFGLQLGSAGSEQERAERKYAEMVNKMAFGLMTEKQMHKAMDRAKSEMSSDP